MAADPLMAAATNFVAATSRLPANAAQTAATQWLERTLECHQARRVLENTTSAGDADPFWLEDGWVDIQVQPASAAFIAQLRGRTFQEAELIHSRAEAFVASLEAK